MRPCISTTSLRKHPSTLGRLSAALLHDTVLCCAVLYCTVLHCAVLCCTVRYCAVLYCTVLYCTVLCCTVLYCTVLCLLCATQSHCRRGGGTEVSHIYSKQCYAVLCCICIVVHNVVLHVLCIAVLYLTVLCS